MVDAAAASSKQEDIRQATRRRRNHVLWIGPLVVFAGAVSYFMVFARYPMLRDFPWVNLPLVAAGLFVSGLAMWRAYRRPSEFRGKILGPPGFLFSAGISFLFGFYIFWYSYQLPPAQESTLSLAAVPAFSLTDQDGNVFSSTDLRGRKAVITFYRGYW